MNHNIFFSKKLGFTLIELLVAIGIIALLTAIITANFSDARAKSRDAKRISDIAQIQLALTYYFDRCNTYPQSIYDLDNPYSPCPSTVFSTFISKIPTDPKGNQYDYYVKPASSQGIRTDYILRTTLEKDSYIIDESLSNDIPAGLGGYQKCNSNADNIICPACNMVGCECGDDSLNYCVGPN